MFKVFNKQTLGALGEEQAQKFLQKKGYQLLHKNYRCRHGEIDLVMLKNQSLVIVEVKSGTHQYVSPKVHFNYNKKRKLVHLAQIFLLSHAKYNNYTVQFDLVVYKPNESQSIEHYPQAIDDVNQL